MSEIFSAIRARLVIERDKFLRRVDVLDEEAQNIARDRDKFRAQADALTLAIDMMEQSEEAKGEGTDRRRLNIADAICAALTDSPGERSFSDICATVGRKPSQVKPALARLLLSGRVKQRTDTGAYCVPAVAA